MSDRDATWIRLQLTLMRWYLDAASNAATEAVHQHIQHAWHVYEISQQALSTCQLTYDERSELERELSVLGAELELGGAPSATAAIV